MPIKIQTYGFFHFSFSTIIMSDKNQYLMKHVL